MATDFDRFAGELQQVLEGARKVYSDEVIEAFHSPKNLGRMSEPGRRGIVQGWCGDTMEICLRLKGDRIEGASFVTDGCRPSVTRGSMFATMVPGMSLDETGDIRPGDLLKALDGLPDESVHSARLAASTLREAIADRA